MDTVTKVCSRCKLEKGLDLFHADKNDRFGVQPWCKDCRSASRKKVVSPKPVVESEHKRRCARCHQIKSATSSYFNRNRSAKDGSGLDYSCRDCMALFRELKRKGEWVPFVHPTAAIDGQKPCTKCGITKPATKEFFGPGDRRLKAVCRHCERGVGEHVNLLVRALPAPRIEPYEEKSLVIVRCRRIAASANFRAKKMGIPGKLSSPDLRTLYWRARGRCTYCRSRLYGQVAFDHIVPLTKGGHNVLANLTPACNRCNSSKNNRDLETWKGLITDWNPRG